MGQSLKKQWIRDTAIAVALSLASTVALADISGVVFRDLNNDGANAANEPGLGDGVVMAYDDAGTVSATATSYAFDCIGVADPDPSCTGLGTPALGSYVLTLSRPGPYRIEFTLSGDPTNAVIEPIDLQHPVAQRFSLLPMAPRALTPAFITQGTTATPIPT